MFGSKFPNSSYTIDTFSEMISSPTKITRKYLEDKLLPRNHTSISKEYSICIDDVLGKINRYRNKNNHLRIIHLIWSSDKLSKNNKIRVIYEHQKRLADLYVQN